MEGPRRRVILAVVVHLLGDHAVCLGADVPRRVRRRNLNGEQAVAECDSKLVESISRDQFVAGEPHGQNRTAATDPFLDDLERRVAHSEVFSGLRTPEWNRRLTQHRSNDAVVGHHRQTESAGETHADGTYSWSASSLMEIGSQGSQPDGHGAITLGGEGCKLLRNARCGEHPHRFGVRQLRTIGTKETRHGDRHSPVDHGVCELDDTRRDARNLSHHDDPWTETLSVHAMTDPTM